MRFSLFLFCALFSFLYAKSPELLLLKSYKDQNISGYLMSEKLDGIRAYWDGKNLLTRSGKKIHAPKWFTKLLPPFEIDGELWSRRGQFEYIQSIVMDKKPSKKWREITYNIFEVPNQKGSLMERLEVLKKYLKSHKLLHVKITKQITCKNKNHLEKFFKEVKNKGGEGVVLHDPKALYIAKRTSKALKYKDFLDDECEVVSYHKGKGKYEGMLGSFTCKLKNGVTFKIGSGLIDKERRNPPAIGQMITFKYQGLTKYGKPRFPVFLHVRVDK
ncbi:MAG: DNA ligase [Campylobacteraceae bacterium]|nr:DNA ligase [Campylobacteraceae bacterium]